MNKSVKTKDSIQSIENEKAKLINDDVCDYTAYSKRPPGESKLSKYTGKCNLSFGFGTRHTLALLAFIGFFNVFALRANISVALVAMVNNTDSQSNSNSTTSCPEQSNSTSKTDTLNGEFNWDENTQGIILGSFFYGYILTQIPGGRLAEMFGAKKLLGFGILTTSVLTLLTPLAARLDVWAFVATRIVMGFGEGVTIPAMHCMLGKWAPRSETTMLTNFIYGGSNVGYIIVMAITGILCESDFLGGWPSAFYTFGTVGCIWFIFWMLLVHDTPADHPRISQAERLYIESSVGVKLDRNLPVPLKSILTSNALWAIAVAHCTQAWGSYTMMTCLPLYMSKIQRYDITQDGLLMSVMYIVAWVMSQSSAAISDLVRNKKILTTEATRKLMNTIGMLAGGVSLLFIKQAGCDHGEVVILLVISQGISQLVSSGYGVNHIDISPNFAGTLIGITNTLATASGMLAPYAVGLLTENNQTFDQWQIVFYISAGMYTFGAVFFLFFAKGDIQDWNYPDNSKITKTSYIGNHYRNDYSTVSEKSF